MTTEEDFTLYPVMQQATTGEEVVTYSSLTELVLTLLFLVIILTFTVSGKSIFTHYVHRQWFCIMFRDSCFALCSQTVVLHYVHREWFWIMFTDSGFALCSQTVVLLYVHREWFCIMFTDSAFSVASGWSQ